MSSVISALGSVPTKLPVLSIRLPIKNGQPMLLAVSSGFEFDMLLALRNQRTETVCIATQWTETLPVTDRDCRPASVEMASSVCKVPVENPL